MMKRPGAAEGFFSHRSLVLALVFAWCLSLSQKTSVSAFLTAQHPGRALLSNNAPNFDRQRVVSYYGDLGASGKRAAEIRRKIAQLKKEGRLKKEKKEQDEIEDDDNGDEVPTSSVKEVYGDKVKQKLGEKKSKLLGFVGSDKDAEDEDDDEEPVTRMGQLGGLSRGLDEQSTAYTPSQDSASSSRTPIIDPSLFEDDSDDSVSSDPELEEQELVDMVAMKMREKRDRERREKERRLRDEAREQLAAIEKKRKEEAASSDAPKKLTTGVGGSWSEKESDKVEIYKPKTGSWGAFPRPKDISKAYGGGRRVGAGYTKEGKSSEEDTRERLKRYREKAGIDVQSEKDHAEEIDEALRIGGLAMQRGLYSTAVSALEKVTKWCSTNSKVGGKVFLDLAMAYEAVGRTQEAVSVYTTLSSCRIEEIKFNAKRLLYGIEAMQFMRDEMKDSNFSRKKAKNTFIDTTGLKYISENFDDKYQTAYIDLEGSFYKRLTESVVRTAREARQILLRATNAGEVDRMRIVQALRSLSRNFEEALEKEIEQNVVKEPVAVMDGRPIMPSRAVEEEQYAGGMSDTFVLGSPEQMAENLDGKWRLQLLADKRGDGVKFFNNTMTWQRLGMENGGFDAEIPGRFGSVQLSGTVDFNSKMRILRRKRVESAGGGVFAGLVNQQGGPSGAVKVPQQVMMVDSNLLVTRGVPNKRSQASKDDEKEYFAVWRRAD